MDFNFDWNYVSAGAPYVTVSELSLAINSPAAALIGCPEEVVAGFDQEKLAIGIKSADGMPGVKKYKFASRFVNGWVRIGCKDFLKNLSEIYGISFTPARKYVARLDDEQKVLYILLNEKEDEERVNEA